MKGTRRNHPGNAVPLPEPDGAYGLHTAKHDLVERIKELNCLYGISKLVELDLVLPELLQRIVELIPLAWQYPEVTCARIRLRRRAYVSYGFNEGPWRQSEVITLKGRKAGTLDVFYVEDRPGEFEGPFLKEERDLIHGIAERLQHIVESKDAEIALRDLYRRERRLRSSLQREMESRVAFTRHLIHELKTPLTSLLATSQLLSEETAGTRLSRLSGFVWEGASRLNGRIDELHDVTRGEMGNLRLQREWFTLEDLVRSVVEETRALAFKVGITVTLDIPGSISSVHADADRVRQVLLNLINNACRYAASGKRLDIVLKDLPSEGVVLTEVRDRGPGIRSRTLSRVFSPGFLSTAAEAAGGLGIGLPLCRILVELHGGKIWAESVENNGASFFFTLPSRV